MDVRAYERCELLTLVGLGAGNAGRTLRIIAPFDLVHRMEVRLRPRFIRPALWRRACRALIAADMPPGALKGARSARMDLLPYQLEPALALVRGLGSRVLLADDVGLGKTVQAGLILSELRARGGADRILILTPPGLRDQWILELGRRFGMNASLVDVAAVGRLASTLPVGLNPWTTVPVAVTSIDYIKRPEVLPALLSRVWDVVVVDEAHGAAAGNDRHAAVSTLAARAAYVVLVTATPHSGDRDAFLSLCAAGSVTGDSLLVFRRSREDVGLDTSRHIHRLFVRPSGDESRMHAMLGRFTREVRRERGDATLALSVLHKRALSSAHSLERSLARRLAALSATHADGHEQLALPMSDPAGELSADDEAPMWPEGASLRDARRERRILQTLAETAAAAARHETKITALLRLLRRIAEPVIVFTEYRDTLLHLERRLDRQVVVLHGGMTREERLDSLGRFAKGGRVVLLATDAAGQGLNLHGACRVVINLELPWNPMRLEQRIGRVDRIGQRRRVHAFHLIARGTGETLILDRLKARVARARTDIRVADPLGADAEEGIARLIVDGTDPGDRTVARGGALDVEADNAHLRVEPALASEAVAEAGRLARARLMWPVEGDEAVERLEGRGPARTRPRRWQTRSRLGSRLILLWRLACEDGCGQSLASIVVPLSAPKQCADFGADEIIERFGAEFERRVYEAAEGWRREAARLHRAFVISRLERERAIALGRGALESGAIQAGLFDRRVQLARAAAAAIEQDEDRERHARVAEVERSLAFIVGSARLLLVLAP